MDFHKIIDEFYKYYGMSVKELSVPGFSGYELDVYDLPHLLKFLKRSEYLRFTILTDLFAADFIDRENRFEVVYSLLSLKFNKRILLKAKVPEGVKVPSVANVFSAACWYEREIFDMFGIEFADSPDMRRILTDYSFIGHPLRKDFPLSGHVQVKYDEVTSKVVYEPVSLEQEFREFDFSSPWSGPSEYNLPGDEKVTK
ncbi:MAG: hypothetical protein DGJ47_000133 [Rickettsiaceae bacterium]